jgi:hypothetical protein
MISNMSSKNIPEATTELAHYDVLLGRGAASINYVGNVLFREIVKERREQYLSTARRQTKDNIAREIIDVVNSRKGRFLRKVVSVEEKNELGIPEYLNAYVVVDKQKVIEKVKQSLRDKEYNPQEKLTTRTYCTSDINLHTTNEEGKSIANIRDSFPKTCLVPEGNSSWPDAMERCRPYSSSPRILQQIYESRTSNSVPLRESLNPLTRYQNEDSLFQMFIRPDLTSSNNACQYSVLDRVNQLLRERQELNRYHIQPSMLNEHGNHAAFSPLTRTIYDLPIQRNCQPHASRITESVQLINGQFNGDDDGNLPQLLNQNQNNSLFQVCSVQHYERNLRHQQRFLIEPILEQSNVRLQPRDLTNDCKNRSEDVKKEARVGKNNP